MNGEVCLLIKEEMKMKPIYSPRYAVRKDYEKLTIDELIILAKQKRSIKHPFKKYLIDYLLVVRN